MPTFTPPTVKQSVGGDRLFSRYGVEVGQSVVKRGGTYHITPYPWLGEIADLEEGVDYFLGGRMYVVSSEIIAALSADGISFQHYGQGPYGSGPYGGQR